MWHKDPETSSKLKLLRLWINEIPFQIIQIESNISKIVHKILQINFDLKYHLHIFSYILGIKLKEFHCIFTRNDFFQWAPLKAIKNYLWSE